MILIILVYFCLYMHLKKKELEDYPSDSDSGSGAYPFTSRLIFLNLFFNKKHIIL